MRKFIEILVLLMLVSLLSACDYNQTTATGTPAAQTISGTADHVNLSWTPPTQRSDGSYLPLSELAGYRVYMGTSRGGLTPYMDLDDDSITQYTVPNLPAGDYYFAVTAFDTEGLESNLSEIILVHLS